MKNLQMTTQKLTFNLAQERIKAALESSEKEAPDSHNHISQGIGNLEDLDAITPCGCSRNSYDKYKREIKKRLLNVEKIPRRRRYRLQGAKSFFEFIFSDIKPSPLHSPTFPVPLHCNVL